MKRRLKRRRRIIEAMRRVDPVRVVEPDTICCPWCGTTTDGALLNGKAVLEFEPVMRMAVDILYRCHACRRIWTDTTRHGAQD